MHMAMSQGSLIMDTHSRSHQSTMTDLEFVLISRAKPPGPNRAGRWLEEEDAALRAGVAKYASLPSGCSCAARGLCDAQPGFIVLSLRGPMAGMHCLAWARAIAKHQAGTACAERTCAPLPRRYGPGRWRLILKDNDFGPALLQRPGESCRVRSS